MAIVASSVGSICGRLVGVTVGGFVLVGMGVGVAVLPVVGLGPGVMVLVIVGGRGVAVDVAEGTTADKARVGRVAEALVLNDISTGAQNDLERASSIVRKMITEYGMSEDLGPLTFGHKSEEVFLGRDISRDRNYSDAIAYAIDKEASHYMDASYNKAEKILSDNINKLHLIAARLIETETMEAEEFGQIMTGTQTESEPEA